MEGDVFGLAGCRPEVKLYLCGSQVDSEKQVASASVVFVRVCVTLLLFSVLCSDRILSLVGCFSKSVQFDSSARISSSSSS